MMRGWSNGELIPRHSDALHQPTLFKQSIGDFVAAVGVSLDEMDRWHREGWLSFDPPERASFDQAEYDEVMFLLSLVRFGLNDAWINKLLLALPRPYCYDTDTTFYSFAARSWITLPSKPELCVEDELDGYLSALAQQEEWDKLGELRDTIDQLLERHATG